MSVLGAFLWYILIVGLSHVKATISTGTLNGGPSPVSTLSDPNVSSEHKEPAETEDQHLEPVYESLRKRGHRITAQREVILQIFREQAHGTHLSAEELYSKLLERGSTVSLATTYRTLKLLSTLGLLRELDFAEGHKHYELKQDKVPHQHIICISCNTTIEFEDHFLEEAGQKIGARYDFEVIDAQFKIFGTCLTCRQSGNTQRYMKNSRP